MIVRESTEQDLQAIGKVHLEAFDPSEGSSIVSLVETLLDDDSARPLISLVAEENGVVVGHVIFSALSIAGNEDVPASILAPLAVLPGRHGRGIGTGLVEHGLAMLEERGVELVLVLGDPGYYSRFGFRAGHAISPPYDLPYPEAWMAKELDAGVLKRVKGTVTCADALMPREYW